MDRAKALALLPIITAYANGETIQLNCKGCIKKIKAGFSNPTHV